MFSRLTIAQKLLIIGTVWLTGCTLILTVYLVSQSKRSLLQSAVKRSQIIATRLAEEASVHLHAGNRQAVEDLLKEITRTPEVYTATVEENDRIYGNNVTGRIELDPPSGVALEGSHLIRVSGITAIESSVPILYPSRTDVLSDESIFGKAGDRERRGRAVVVLSVEPILQQVGVLITSAMIFLGMLLFFWLLLGWGISTAVTSPLRQLARRAHVLAVDNGTLKETGAALRTDEVSLIWDSLSDMKHQVDRKTAEITQLQVHFEESVRKRTANLQEMNNRLNDVLRLKNDLILQLSHEVKTPIAAMSGLIANLQDGFVDPITEKQKEYLVRIQSISDRVKRLVSALLQFAIAEAGDIPLDRRPVGVADVAREVLFALESIQNERGVTCMIADTMQGKVAFADPDRLQQVFLNLVHNAVKAGPPGSTVLIDAREAESELTVSITDSGLGIDPSHVSKIFREPLSSERENGNGVGLYITRYLVELHGGRIWFDTQQGKGTTFFFTLPKSKLEEKASCHPVS